MSGSIISSCLDPTSYQLVKNEILRNDLEHCQEQTLVKFGLGK